MLTHPMDFAAECTGRAEQCHVLDALHERLSALDKHPPPPPLRLPWQVSLSQKLLSPLTDSYTGPTTPPLDSLITALLPAALRHSARRFCYWSPPFFRDLCKIAKSDYYSSRVCQYVRMENLGPHEADFHKIWYSSSLRKSCRELKYIGYFNNCNFSKHE